MKKNLFGVVCLLLAAATATAQSDFGVWASIEGATKLNKSLELSLEGEYRTQDMSSMTERIATGISLSYKNKNFLPFLKADVGYTFMSMNYLGETTIKYEIEDDGSYELDDEGNPIPKHMNVDASYWVVRHRATASLTGSVKWGRFKFSLRERYQFTHRMRSYCDRTRWYYDPYHVIAGTPEYYIDDDPESGDYSYMTDEKKSKSDHKLRSRLAVSYDIKKCPFEPFAEVEVYNELDKAFAYDKIRYTIGTEYKINKEHKLSLYYRYQDYADVDEVSGHVLGIGYAFEF
jgi:opacity protein-like surface antigen